tara:strand:+ start:738 stop:1484 length:747 start_codon:yes stop_codon:yes gene_type:complete
MKKYVKEYKGKKVPEGATHYIESADLLFYRKNIRKDWVYFSESVSGWAYANISKLSLDVRATELPEAQQELDWNAAPSDIAVWITANDSRISAGWFEYDTKREVFMACDGRGLWWPANSEDMEVHYQPTINQPESAKWNGEGLPPENIQCLVELASRWGKDKKVCITGVLFSSVDGEKRLCEVDGEWFDGFESQFYPLKTQQEKDREALEKLLIGLQPALISEDCQRYFDAYLEDLLDNVIAAPKAGD